MGESQLVDERWLDTANLLHRTDAFGVGVDAAFWVRDEADDWKLYLHTPLMEKKSRTKAYKAIQAAMEGLNGTIKIQDINLLRGTDDLLRALQQYVETGKDIPANIHLTNATINGVFRREIRIIRMTKSQPF